jgi:O-glycosyl hydrolase
MTQVLVEAIRASGLAAEGVKVSPLESGEWKKSEVYVDKLLDDPELASALDHLAIHSYWSTRDDKAQLIRYLNKYHPNTRLWMTEWTEMTAGRDTTMDSALVLANTLHDDLTIGGVTSWQYWIAVSRYDYHDGLIYVNTVNTGDHAVIETKRLWAMGNYSRYIRPGYTRIEAASTLDTLQVTAYRAPNKNQLVIVVINNANRAPIVQLNAVPVEFTGAAVYETSADKNLQAVYMGAVPQTITFAPLSVTTIVVNVVNR